MIKQLLPIFLILFTIQVNAQIVSGTVSDITTNLPIANVLVITKNATITTNEFGRFSISAIAQGDKMTFRILGYETQEITVTTEILNANINIKLYQQIIDLRAINIKANRNYKKDSLALRKEYAAVFDYKTPDFTDMFIKVDPSYRSPFANINPNSTASLLKFNALSAFKLFGKKGKTTSKFKSTLLKDEENNFIAQSFSKDKVAEITKLSGDSLINFMNLYRPTIIEAKKMTGYELNLYIKKSFSEFSSQKK